MQQSNKLHNKAINVLKRLYSRLFDIKLYIQVLFAHLYFFCSDNKNNKNIQ